MRDGLEKIEGPPAHAGERRGAARIARLDDGCRLTRKFGKLFTGAHRPNIRIGALLTTSIVKHPPLNVLP